MDAGRSLEEMTLTDKNLIKRKFKNSVIRGTGEAHLLMQKHPEVDFSTAIIKAAVKNFAYDAQAEGSRALYISELITLSKQQDKIRKVILNRLATEDKDTWSLVQLFDLATFFAKQGDTNAKQAIYNRFYNKIIEGSDWCGADSITELDGIEGLKFIASTIGKSLENNADQREDSMIIDAFQDEYPTINAAKELEKAGKENKYIKIYLDNIKQTEANRKKYQHPVYTLETVRERIANSKFIFIPPFFTKSLSANEIKILADELLIEKEKPRIGKYLSIFSRIKFPYDYKLLMKFAKMRVSNKDRIAEWAVHALQFFSGNDIRKLALEKLKHTSSPSIYTYLLVSNYKQGDAKLLRSLVTKSKNEHTLHNLAFSFVEIYGANKTKSCKAPLEAMYDKLTCGTHRTTIVKILLENNVLSDKIRQEIKYDSTEETRQLINEKK